MIISYFLTLFKRNTVSERRIYETSRISLIHGYRTSQEMLHNWGGKNQEVMRITVSLVSKTRAPTLHRSLTPHNGSQEAFDLQNIGSNEAKDEICSFLWLR